MIMRLKLLSLVLFAYVVPAPVIHAQTASLLPPEKVLAANQRTSITYTDFEAELARIPPRDQFEFLLDRQRLAQMVDNILLNKTLAIEARENKLDGDAKVQAEIRNQTDKVLAKYRGQQVQINAPKIDYLPGAREIYLANPERFTTPPLHDVWHALVSLKGRTREQAKARAEEIRGRLLAGESAELLATSLSDDESAKTNKGNLGRADTKNYDVRFAAAVKKLKVGEVSPVFESDYGYHVAKLLEYVAPVRHPFEAVKEELLHEVESQYLRSVWDNHLRRIRNDPKLFVDAEALDILRPKLPPIPPLVPAAAAPKK